MASSSSDKVSMISWICPDLRVMVLPGDQSGEKGSVIHFPFAVQHVINHLSHVLNDAKVILSAVGIAKRETFHALLERMSDWHVYQSLLWLRARNDLKHAILHVTNHLFDHHLFNYQQYPLHH